MATEMTTDEMLALELEMLESSERNPRKCADCDHSWMAEECEISDTFSDGFYEKVGWCEYHTRFILDEDTEISEGCDAWSERE